MKAFWPDPPSYPARPMDGGRQFPGEPLRGLWKYRPKFKGRRVLCHIPTMRTWNRELEEVGYMHPAFKKLQLLVGMRWPECEWIDCEFIWGTTSVGKGAIIVLDYVVAETEWSIRQSTLQGIFEKNQLGPNLKLPEKEQVYWCNPLIENTVESAWEEMQEINDKAYTTFYEGLVGYDMEARYPIQLFSSKRMTQHWMKYRFRD
jgi:hypothetical protein